MGTTAEEKPYPPPGYAWYVVGVLTLVYVFSYMDRQILTYLVDPIRRDLDISLTEMSYLMGFTFALFYTLFGLPLGRLADTRNRCLLIAAGLFVWTLMTAACGLARYYWHLLLLRVGVGIGEASLGPSAYSMLTDYFPPQRRATAISVYSMGIWLGTGLATLLGGVVAGYAQRQGTLELPVLGAVRSWQLVFLVIGVAGLLPLLLLLTVREPARRGGIKAQAVSPGETLVYLRRNLGTLVCVNLAFALLAIFNFAVGAWLPTFMGKTHSWSLEEMGLYFGLNIMVTGTVGIVAGGWLADWLAGRGWRDANLRVGLLGVLGFFPTSMLFPLVEDDMLCFLLMIPATFFIALPNGVAAAAVQEIVPSPMRGQSSAIYLFIVNLVGYGLGPSTVAWITDYGFAKDLTKLRYALVIVGVVVHVLAGIVLLLGLKAYRASRERAEQWSATPP